jgi:uncharacterized membrane protein (UPF0127 family)
VTRGNWVAALAAGILLIGGVAIVVVALAGNDDDEAAARPSGPIAGALADAEPARVPFTGSTATTIGVGGEQFDVVLADERDEQYQGLREREDIAPYDGMLFVFGAPTRSSFTMSTVPVPLDIGFYDAQGTVVDRLLMKPCPDSQSRCPLYSPKADFTYALETLEGDLPAGPLSR